MRASVPCHPAIVGFTDGVHFECDRGIGWNQIAGNGALTEANGQRVGCEAFAGLVARILQDATRIGGLGIGISNAASKAAAIGGIRPVLGERARSPSIAPTNGPQFQWPPGVHVRCLIQTWMGRRWCCRTPQGWCLRSSLRAATLQT